MPGLPYLLPYRDNPAWLNFVVQLLYLQTDNGPEFRSRALEEWTDDYNRNRPQKGLKGLTPEQFKNKLLSAKPNLNSGRTLG